MSLLSQAAYEKLRRYFNSTADTWESKKGPKCKNTKNGDFLCIDLYILHYFHLQIGNFDLQFQTAFFYFQMRHNFSNDKIIIFIKLNLNIEVSR